METLEQPKKRPHVGRVLGKCKAAFPALAGALIAAAAAHVLSQRTPSVKVAEKDVSAASNENKVRYCNA